MNKTDIKNIFQKNNQLKKIYDSYLKLKIFFYFKFLNTDKIRDLELEVLNIEFTSICNLRCRWCSLDNSRPKGFMELKLFKKILDEVTKSKIKHIALHHGGETLLHPNLKEMLSLLGNKKASSKNFPLVSLLTNATTLNQDITKIILDSNSIDWIRFSIDGGNKEDFENIRTGAKWGEVLLNVNHFLDESKKSGKNIKTSIFSIIGSSNKISDEFKQLIEKVDGIKITQPHNWDGSKDLGLQNKLLKGGCFRALKSMAILWDGRVVPCCIDLNGRGIIGDLKKQTLAEIYKGKERMEMLNLMKNNQRDKIELCHNCDNF